MKTGMCVRKVVFALVMLVALLLVTHGAQAQPALFNHNVVQQAKGLELIQDAMVLDQTQVAINFDALSPKGFDNAGAGVKTLRLDLLNGVSLVAELDRVAARTADSYTWSGGVQGVAGGHVTLVAHDGVLAGNIQTPNALYRVRQVAGDDYVIMQLNPAAFLSEGQPLVRALTGMERDAQLKAVDPNDPLDLMVLYTPAARASEGGVQAMAALVQLAVDEANRAYANSGVKRQLRLVHTEEVTYAESGSLSKDLTHLTDPSDGVMDQVHALRDKHRADLVSLFEKGGDAAGIAFLMREPKPEFAQLAFSVVVKDYAASYYTLAHELGHNMGCAHDQKNAGGNGVFEYSFGYQQPQGQFRTVMAYDCPGRCTRVPYFSNSEVRYQGVVTGLTQQTENALTLNKTMDLVAGYRRALGLWQRLEGAVAQAPEALEIKTNQQTFKVGETLTITCRIPQDGYLNVLHLGEGKDRVDVLFPNQYESENRVKAGQVVRIGSPDDAYRLPAQPPAGKSLVAVFLTGRPINAYQDAGGGKGFVQLDETKAMFMARDQIISAAGKAVIEVVE